MNRTPVHHTPARCWSVFLVSADGRRASLPVLHIVPAVPLLRAVSIALKAYNRFVILDDKEVQHYASDDRDATGAYLPYNL